MSMSADPTEAPRRVPASDAAAFGAALEAARDFRGDVTLELLDGTQIEGFVYDRSQGPSAAVRKLRMKIGRAHV